MHLFAHNGMLPGIERDDRFRARWARPVGDTDSEYAFCALIDRMRPLWERGVPDLQARWAEIVRFATELRTLGPANFGRARTALESPETRIICTGDERIVLAPAGSHKA